MDKTRVLIVDDSAVVRNVLTQLLSQEPTIEVVGSAVDPYEARDKIKQLRPDVLTLDIEMPRMDGITFLRNLMKLNPLPVVMLSSLTTKGADATLQALELGAVDYIAKPTAADSDEGLRQFQEELISKVTTAAASAAKMKFKKPAVTQAAAPPTTGVSLAVQQRHIIAIGSSTGGTEALHEILAQLPAEMPPIVVTQHIPASFSARFAQRLDRNCALTVVEAKDGDTLKPGCVYIAPGDRHLVLNKHGQAVQCALDAGPAVNRHKPSVEVMINSLQTCEPKRVVTLMLTGMGEDGAAAMSQLAQQGAYAIAQDEASSMVWGMPGALVRLGAANEIVPLPKIAQRLVEYLSSDK